jgi:hypothetical protein
MWLGLRSGLGCVRLPLAFELIPKFVGLLLQCLRLAAKPREFAQLAVRRTPRFGDLV